MTSHIIRTPVTSFLFIGSWTTKPNYKLLEASISKEFLVFFFFAYLPSPNLGLTPPGTYNPNARGSDACARNCLWTRTLDRHTRAGLPECVVSTMSGTPPNTTQYRIQTKDTPNSRTEIKIPDPVGNRTRAAGLESRDSTDHATATDEFQEVKFIVGKMPY